jgi:cAMP-specific phosphodiesterase 4
MFSTFPARTSFLFSALMHDVDHPGKNNQFMVNSMSKLAMRYNDDTVLENHHCAFAFKLLLKSENYIFRNMKREDWVTFRKNTIEAILSTDMKRHFNLVAKLDRVLLETPGIENFNEETNNENFILLMSIMCHTSDLYTPTKAQEVSRSWVERLNSEFKNQWDCERESGLPETPFFKGLDNHAVVAKSEMFFVGKIVMP